MCIKPEAWRCQDVIHYEEKEIPYPVGLVIFIGEGEKTPMTRAGSLKQLVPGR